MGRVSYNGVWLAGCVALSPMLTSCAHDQGAGGIETMSESRSQELAARRAYRLHKGEALVGHLGEGAGPFISASRHTGPVPQFDHARFTCRDYGEENAIVSVLLENSAFEAVVSKLQSMGYELERLPYNEVFGDPREAPRYQTPGQEETSRRELSDAVEDIP